MNRERKNEHWFQKHWRPAMAWSYMVICLWDFLIAPLFFAILETKYGLTHTIWRSLTLSEGGLYHMAMGAIVGVAAWTRGQEKITQINNPYYRGDNYPSYDNQDNVTRDTWTVDPVSSSNRPVPPIPPIPRHKPSPTVEP